MEWIGSQQAVRLVRGQEHHPLPARHAREEGHEAARRRIRVLEIFDQHGHRLPSTEPLEQPEHGLEHPRFAPLRRGHRGSLGQEFEFFEAVPKVRHEAGQRVARGADEIGEDIGRQRIE